MKRKASIQPNWNKAIKIGLTPNEIFSLAGKYSTAMTSWRTHVDCFEGFSSDQQLATNPRTGLECKMVFTEFEREKNETNDDYDFFYQYIVELNTGKGYMVAFFETIAGNDGDLAHQRNEAEKTFISWSGLIGVKLEQKLTSAYPLHALKKKR